VEAPDGLEHEVLGAGGDGLLGGRHADPELERAALVGEEGVDRLLAHEAGEVGVDHDPLLEVDASPPPRVVDGQPPGPAGGREELEQVDEGEQAEGARHVPNRIAAQGRSPTSGTREVAVILPRCPSAWPCRCCGRPPGSTCWAWRPSASCRASTCSRCWPASSSRTRPRSPTRADCSSTSSPGSSTSACPWRWCSPCCSRAGAWPRTPSS